MSTYVRYLVWLNNLWMQHRLEPTPEEFASHVQIPIGRAKVALLRLHQRGLARRKKDTMSVITKPSFRYRPSKRGLREARTRGTDPDVADESHQIELFHEMKALVDAGRQEESSLFYATRRQAWGTGFWKIAARQLRIESVLAYVRGDGKGSTEHVPPAAARLGVPSERARTTTADEVSISRQEPARPGPADSRPQPKHACSIASFVPPVIWWRPSHIVLEPAINPLTGEFLLDRENRPVYNQLFEPWEPERREMVASAVAAGAVATAVLASEYRATILSEKYEARIAALQAENHGLQSKLRMRTLEAGLYEELYRISLALAERQRADERDRIEEWSAALDESLSSSGTRALVMQEGLDTLATALGQRSERLDRFLVALEPVARTLGHLLERSADRELGSVARAAPPPTERKTRGKVRSL